MSKDRDSLSRLTLRQLRTKASDLGVPLYSRKTKASLVHEIALYQEKIDSENNLVQSKQSDESRQSLTNSLLNTPTSTRVVFLPRDPEWAYVFWEISEPDKNRAQEQGASRLFLRLSDATGLKDGGVNPGTLREVPVDSHSTEWYLPIPMGDRDYRVELGYRCGREWVSLAISSIARVPSLHPAEQIIDQFVPFSLEAPLENNYENSPVIENTDRGLHELLYQTATTTTFRKNRVGSEEFQEIAEDTKLVEGLNDSGLGLWASGRNESGIGGITPKDRSFWLVADAELIVYGSTDPSARLRIGGQEVPLASDGTFRLQVPFRDGVQNYSIEAEDISGQQKRNINMKFERVTLEDNTNPIDKAKTEWF